MNSKSGQLMKGLVVVAVVVVLGLMFARSRDEKKETTPTGKPIPADVAGTPTPVAEVEPAKPQESRPAPRSENANVPVPVAQPISTEQIQKEMERVKKDLSGRPKPLAEELKRMAAKSEFYVKVVLALAGEEWCAEVAVEALGLVRDPVMKEEVMVFLWGKTSGASVELACDALKSYGMVGGAEAVPKLGEYILGNYRRPDGFGESVCAAAVQALSEIPGDASLEVLLSELKRGREKDWLPDYGSKVIAAVGRHDMKSGGISWVPESRQVGLTGKNKEQIRVALLDYAESLRAKLPGPTNPIGQQYLEEKIAEAETLAGAAKGEPKVQ